MPKITPCLWVDKDAKAVVDYYLSIFKDGKMKEYRQYKNPPKQKSKVAKTALKQRLWKLVILNLVFWLPAHTSSLMNLFLLLLIAKTRRKWIIIGML